MTLSRMLVDVAVATCHNGCLCAACQSPILAIAPRYFPNCPLCRRPVVRVDPVMPKAPLKKTDFLVEQFRLVRSKAQA